MRVSWRCGRRAESELEGAESELKGSWRGLE